MSNTTTRPNESHVKSDKRGNHPADSASANDPIESFVLDKISAAQDALWRAELTRRVLILVIASMTIGLGWLVMDQWIWSPGVWGRTFVATVLLAAVAAYAYLRLWPVVHLRIREDYAARALERDHPELGHALSSYVSLRQQRASHPRGQLAQRVVQSVGANAAAKLKHIDAPPSEATGLISWWVTAIALLALLAIYALASPKNSAQSVARLVRPLANLDAPRRVQITDVAPGDTETLAGRSLEIGATVKNLGDDEPVYFRWDTPQNDLDPSDDSRSNAGTRGETSQTQTQLLLSNADGDLDRYVATIPISHHAKGTRRYHIVAGDASVGPYQVSIRDTPVVQVREVIYSPPAYTGKTKHTSHTGSIQGVDGTKVELVASVNRPITRAIIEFNPRKVGQDIQATAGASEMQIAGDGTSVRFAFPLRSRKGGAIELQDYRIRVWDDVGQTNADPIVYPIRVVEDLPPEITIVVPQQSVKDVPIDSEQVFEIHAADVDYGLAEVEIEIHRGIDLIARSTLWKEPAGKLGNQVIEYRFRPSRMIVVARDGGIRARRGGGLIVGDEVEVVAIATDNRTDPNDATIVPGVTRTEPVRLRITAATSPNNQPANEPNQRQGNRDSSQQQGGGQSDDGQQGGSGGGQSGEGQQGEGQQGEGQQGEGQQGEGQQGGDSQGQNQSGDSNSDDASDPGSETTESGGEDSDSDGSDNGGSSKGQPSNDGKNTPSENDRSDSNDSPPSENSDAQSSQGNNANASENNQSGKPNGGDPSNAANNTPQTPPQDDAEAFERIQDYLNEKRNNPSENQDSGNRDSSRQPNDDRNQNGGNSGEQSNQQQPGDSGNESESTEGQGSDDNDASGEQSRDGNPPRGQDPNENASETSNESDQPTGDNSRDPSMNDQDGSQSQNQNRSQNENTQNDAARDKTNSARDESTNDQRPSDGASGDQSSDNQSNDGRSDDSQTGESERTEQSGKDDSSESGEGSEKGNDEQGSNSDSDQDASADNPSGQNRDSQSGNRDADPSRSDESGASDNQDGSPQGDSESDSPSGEQPDRQPGQNGESQSQTDGSPSDSQSGDPREQDPNQDPGNSDMPASNTNSSNTNSSNANSSNPSSDRPGEPSPFDQNPSSDSSQGGGSGQSGGGVGEEVPAEDELPDPVDMEYTKAATDMVLDYLDEMRTDPDPELLERLKWTEQDLRRFRQRWQDIKPIDGAPPTDGPAADEIEEALRSLGMRPPGNTQSNRRDRADDIRGLRDSGNRRPAPANIRDAFDAFRRGISRD